MSLALKGDSPFYPGHPVPVEYFVGREREVKRMTRALSQVGSGKPRAVFVSGSYGIGKSSLAKLIGTLGERNHGLVYLHVLLGTARHTEDIGEKLVEALVNKPSLEPGLMKKVREGLGQYIAKVSVLGVTIDFARLRADSPTITRGALRLLDGVVSRGRDDDARGIVLVLDEINGLAAQPAFAHFLKELVDGNALRDQPLPLLLIVCGTEERYSEIVACHEPVARIFQIAQLDALSAEESRMFFRSAFVRVGLALDPDAEQMLVEYSGGLPKVMHILGDKAFWLAADSQVDQEVAWQTVLEAAEDIGRQFVAPLYRQLRSERYRSILPRLGQEWVSGSFRRSDVQALLTEAELKVFDNLLRKLRELKLIRPGPERGEYEFTDRLTPIYLVMQGAREERRSRGGHG